MALPAERSESHGCELRPASSAHDLTVDEQVHLSIRKYKLILRQDPTHFHQVLNVDVSDDELTNAFQSLLLPSKESPEETHQHRLSRCREHLCFLAKEAQNHAVHCTRCEHRWPKYFKLPHLELDLTDAAENDPTARKAAYYESCKALGGGALTMDFCTLGMFILDEIHFESNADSIYSVVGGAGAWAAFGARVATASCPHLVSWIVHAGHDFPPDVRAALTSWQTNLNWIETPERQTTRGWNRCLPDGEREFRYSTPKIRIDETLLSKDQLLSKTFHLICSPSRCIDLVKGIRRLRQQIIDESKPAVGETVEPLKPVDPPLFIWEPVPDSCKRSEFDNVIEAMHYVDVMSPNYLEFKNLFPKGDDFLGSCGMDWLKVQCIELLKKGFGKRPSAIIVRLGEHGCYVASHSRHVRLPAYFEPKFGKVKMNPKVVDPTGGGNAFLGGFCMGVLPHSAGIQIPGLNRFEFGAVVGTIAASFAIQQFGMPAWTDPKLGTDNPVDEHWNGERFMDRWEKYAKRLRPLTLNHVDPKEPWGVDHVDHPKRWDAEASSRRRKALFKHLHMPAFGEVTPKLAKRSEIFHMVPFVDPRTNVKKYRKERIPSHVGMEPWEHVKGGEAGKEWDDTDVEVSEEKGEGSGGQGEGSGKKRGKKGGKKGKKGKKA